MRCHRRCHLRVQRKSSDSLRPQCRGKVCFQAWDCCKTSQWTGWSQQADMSRRCSLPRCCRKCRPQRLCMCESNPLLPQLMKNRNQNQESTTIRKLYLQVAKIGKTTAATAKARANIVGEVSNEWNIKMSDCVSNKLLALKLKMEEGNEERWTRRGWVLFDDLGTCPSGLRTATQAC